MKAAQKLTIGVGSFKIVSQYKDLEPQLKQLADEFERSYQETPCEYGRVIEGQFIQVMWFGPAPKIKKAIKIFGRDIDEIEKMQGGKIR